MLSAPIDVNSTEPQVGGPQYPEGPYLFEIIDATQCKPTKDGSKQMWQYRSRIHYGPGASTQFAGKEYVDGIIVAPDWAGSHMGLYVAAFGSKDAVRDCAAKNGGQLPIHALHGKFYIAVLGKDKTGQYVNVKQRLTYNAENWAEQAGVAPPAAPMQQAAPPAQMPYQAAPAAPPAPPAAPQMQQPYAPPAPPAAPQGYQQQPPPAYPPQAPQGYTPPPAPPQGYTPPPAPPQGYAPQTQGMPPAPPPPPGMPAR